MAVLTSTPAYVWNAVTTGLLAAMATHLSTLLTNGGWVQTGDTGQTASASIPAQGGTNSSGGYQIWRMNDALQGTYPVFIKFEWGSGYTSAYPAMWITIGTGSNGSGTITGIVLARLQINSYGTSGSSATIYMYGSAGTSRICLFQGPLGGGFGLALSIERSKDTSNADTSDGVIVQGLSAGLPLCGYAAFSGINRTPQAAADVVITGSLTDESDGSGNITVFPVFPMAQYGSKNPGLNFRFYATANLPLNNAIPISIRGSNHTYLTLGTCGGFTFITNWAGAGLVILYE